MKVEILETCSLVAQKGSIVEVSESQFEALGGFCRLVSEKPVKKVEKTEETEEKPKKAVRKTTTAKK